MKQLLIFIFLFFSSPLLAQTDNNKLVGEWKFYLSDKVSFEFLRLNADGTGIKCFGQTINNKDFLHTNHFSSLQITNWKVLKNTLTLESTNSVNFKAVPEYKLVFLDSDKIELKGEHLIFYLFPGSANRNEFQRTVIYQRAEKIPKEYGVNSATCINEDRALFSFKQIDKTTGLAVYKGFEDLIPHIVNCNHGFEYVQTYSDLPYSLKVPSSIHEWSLGFGNKTFYISLDTDSTDKSETSIVIYYDFENKMKEFYFSEIKNGKEKKEVVQKNNLDVYKTMNWQGKYEGKVFLPNSIVVAYYTRDKKLQEKLQQCITSFRYN